MRLLLITAMLLIPTDTPPALAVDSTCADYQETHTLIRNDVVSQLNADHKNLPACEQGLSQAQLDLTKAKKDLVLLQNAAMEQRAAIAELRAQKGVLEGHIAKLEGVVCPEPTIGDQIATTWEEVDGVIGLGTGYALGTSMCVGLAYVFNQPAFVR